MTIPEIIRRAIEIGERNGKITFNELGELCEDVERILGALSEAGIWLGED